MANDPIVSSESELLIVVDNDDNILGYETKANCHKEDGLLHRAFSVFLFNKRLETLLQQRSGSKSLWPMFWSNSCCSHPRKGEDAMIAARRRLSEELGVDLPLRPLFTFQYEARYEDRGTEKEICAVYAGLLTSPVGANPTEIHRCEFVDPDELDRSLRRDSSKYTPWLRIEWPRIRQHHWREVSELAREDV